MVLLTLEYIKNESGEFDEQSVFQAILANKSIPRIEAINKCCNLRWLDLSHNQIIRMENLDGLAQLVSLDVSFNKIPKVQSLEGLECLERLKLKSNPIARLQDLDGLKPARKLRHLQFRNIDNTDFCPVCLQEGYQTRIKMLCPDLFALDSRRSHLPDLDKEMLRLEKQQELTLPEPEAWLSPADLNLDSIMDPEAIAAQMQAHVQEYETALASCKDAFREAEDLLQLQELGNTEAEATTD
jgi:Leucine-rich repeat (LRR) protein